MGAFCRQTISAVPRRVLASIAIKYHRQIAWRSSCQGVSLKWTGQVRDVLLRTSSIMECGVLRAMRSFKSIVVLLVLHSPTACFADVPTFEQVQEQCAEWGFAGAMASCYLDKDKSLGAELTVTYNRLKRCYNRARADELVSSQRAWLAYQEKTCRLQERAIEFEGPAIARLSYAACLVKTTLSRMRELYILLDQEECAR